MGVCTCHTGTPFPQTENVSSRTKHIGHFTLHVTPFLSDSHRQFRRPDFDMKTFPLDNLNEIEEIRFRYLFF